MLFDSQLAFANFTALSTAGTGTSVLGTVRDLGETANFNGVMTRPMYLFGIVTTAITAAATSTLQLALVTDSVAALTSSPTTLLSTQALDAASGIAVGTELFNISLPITTYDRYLGIKQIIGAAAITAGKVSIFLTREPGNWKAFPENALAH